MTGNLISFPNWRSRRNPPNTNYDMPIRNCQAIQTALQIASLTLGLRLRERDHGLRLLVGRLTDCHGFSLGFFKALISDRQSKFRELNEPIISKPLYKKCETTKQIFINYKSNSSRWAQRRLWHLDLFLCLLPVTVDLCLGNRTNRSQPLRKPRVLLEIYKILLHRLAHPIRLIIVWIRSVRLIPLTRTGGHI